MVVCGLILHFSVHSQYWMIIFSSRYGLLSVQIIFMHLLLQVILQDIPYHVMKKIDFVFMTIRDFFINYWKHNDTMVDYLMVDYMIALAQKYNRKN